MLQAGPFQTSRSSQTPPNVRPTDAISHMFQSLARLVNTRGWVIFLVWSVVAAALFLIAPKWESVSKDDDVKFFPSGYPSVIGQELLERGFPKDVASSQAVLI